MSYNYISSAIILFELLKKLNFTSIYMLLKVGTIKKQNQDLATSLRRQKTKPKIFTHEIKSIYRTIL